MSLPNAPFNRRSLAAQMSPGHIEPNALKRVMQQPCSCFIMLAATCLLGQMTMSQITMQQDFPPAPSLAHPAWPGCNVLLWGPRACVLLSVTRTRCLTLQAMHASRHAQARYAVPLLNSSRITP